jgi:thiol-disulfide isomerase/thioredoxin
MTPSDPDLEHVPTPEGLDLASPDPGDRPGVSVAGSAAEHHRATGRLRRSPLGLAVGVVAALALVALLWPSSPKTFQAPGGFALDAAGRPTPLGSRLAPVTLLHFWATWCPPCLVEIPKLRAFTNELHGEPRFGLVMVAVNDTNQRVNDFLGPADTGTMLYDPQWEIANRYGTDQLPETYLVVAGEVVEKFVGATDWSDPKVRERVRAHLRAEP